MATFENFVVRSVVDLDFERDVVFAVPYEREANTKSGKENAKVPPKAGFRIPIRVVMDGDGAGLPREFIGEPATPGSRPAVVSSVDKQLARLVLKFPESYCHSLKEYEGDGASMRMGFALFDPRTGPTKEQTKLMERLDAFSAWTGRTLLGCEPIRFKLNVGEPGMTGAAMDLWVKMMDLWVVKPSATGQTGSRYCNTRVVLPTPNNETLRTYFWTPDRKRMSLDEVRALTNFRVIPFVEIEEIFVNKAMRSFQMKLRECIVIPPSQRPTHRLSFAFPDLVCQQESPTDPVDDFPECTAVDGPVCATEPIVMQEPEPVVVCDEGKTEEYDGPLPKRQRTSRRLAPKGNASCPTAPVLSVVSVSMSDCDDPALAEAHETAEGQWIDCAPEKEKKTDTVVDEWSDENENASNLQQG